MPITTAKLEERIVASAIATYVKMDNAGQFTCIASESDAAITINQATDAAGTGAKAVATGTGKVTVTAAELDIAGGFVYVAAAVVGVDSPDTAVAVNVKSDLRFGATYA
jgi:hypothetical protein